MRNFSPIQMMPARLSSLRRPNQLPQDWDYRLLSEWLLHINRVTIPFVSLLKFLAILFIFVYTMQQNWFTEGELRLVAEWRRTYLGTFKVNLDQIEFVPPLPRNLDYKNMERLRQEFQKGRCRRLDAENHIPAIVARHNLNEVLGHAGILQTSFVIHSPVRYPLLNFGPGELRGLHGRHRIQAASELLPNIDRWWMVDLYLDGTVVFHVASVSLCNPERLTTLSLSKISTTN